MECRSLIRLNISGSLCLDNGLEMGFKTQITQVMTEGGSLMKLLKAWWGILIIMKAVVPIRTPVKKGIDLKLVIISMNRKIGNSSPNRRS